MQIAKEEERILTEIVKKVNPKERFTIIQTSIYGGFETIKNVRVKISRNHYKQSPMYLKPRAKKKGYTISTNSVIINSNGEVVYSGSYMIDVCKKHLMARYGYSEEEAETYATLLSER